jgi:hypothetical protein
MQTLTKPKKKAKIVKEPPAEQSIGIRVCAVSLVLLLVLASSSYVPTPPAFIFVYAMVAIAGSYLAYFFRNKRPRWLSALPTMGAILLFANFMFELSFALTSASLAAPAVAAFVHMLAGLLALHCFDLRSRTDFSISALIGLGLLTFLTGVARDLIFGVYVLIYTVLGGMLLFYDSSSRSHEIGPSKAVADSQVPGQPMIRRLRLASLVAMLPIFCIPLASVATCFVLPKGESVLELFVDGFRSQFPMSASLGGNLSRGGRSQSLRGGAPSGKQEGGASYSAKGGDGTGKGTASSAGSANPNGSGSGSSVGGNGSGQGSQVPGQSGGSKKGSAMPGLNGKKDQEFDATDPAMQEALEKERALLENYQKETVELKYAPADLESVVLKVGSPNTTYIRRYTLDTYDGNSWKRLMPVPSKAILPTPKVGFDLTASDSVYVPPDLPTQEVTQEFRVETSMGYVLPHTWLPQIVKIEDPQLRIDGDGTLKLLTTLPEKAHYSITSQVPVYDLEVMRRLPPETLYQLDEDREDELKTAQACLQLPPNLNAKIKEMGADAGGIEGNWFSKAERIAEYVKGHYHYNKRSFLDGPPAAEKLENTKPSDADSSGDANANGARGNGKSSAKGPQPNKAAGQNAVGQPSDMDQFLFERKVGNCRHFASAFALLCRTQGIPARIVVGFLPGELNKKTGYREIRGKDTFVWAEVYIPYWNWVPFDPTPDGQLPAHQEGGNALTKFIASGLANPFGQNVNHRPSRKPDKANATGPDGGQPKPDQNKPGQGLGFDPSKNKPKGSTFQLPWLGTIDQTQIQSVVKLIGVIVLLTVLAAAVVIYLKQQKTARVKELLGQYPPSTLVFLEVLGELKRYEFIKQPTETADELSDRARSQFATLVRGGRHVPQELPEVVSEFMELYNEERFGGADNLDELNELSQRIKSLSNSKAGR